MSGASLRSQGDRLVSKTAGVISARYKEGGAIKRITCGCY